MNWTGSMSSRLPKIQTGGAHDRLSKHHGPLGPIASAQIGCPCFLLEIAVLYWVMKCFIGLLSAFEARSPLKHCRDLNISKHVVDMSNINTVSNW